MVALEKVGMLKIDLLGLKTLTVIHDTVAMVQERHGVTLDMDGLDLEDPEVYALLRSGRTAGVFQFESPLATDCLRQMKCDRFDDLVATNALLRPGPLDTGMHLVFINRKLGREPVRYPHPALEEILAPDLRRDHLPGAGDAHRQRAGRLLARRSRRAAQGGGQEGQGADPGGAGAVRRARRGARATSGGSSRTSRPRSRPSAATGSTSRTPSRTPSSPTRPPGSRRTIRRSSWRRCCRPKSATPTTWWSTSTRPASSASRCSPPT